MVLVLAVMDATERGDGTDCDFWRNKFKVRDRAKDWLGLAWILIFSVGRAQARASPAEVG